MLSNFEYLITNSIIGQKVLSVFYMNLRIMLQFRVILNSYPTNKGQLTQ